MLFAIVGLVLMLYLLDRCLRGGRIDSLRLETRIKLSRIRSMLWQLAAEGDVRSDSFAFRSLDRMLEESPELLDNLSLFGVFGQALSTRKAKNAAVCEFCAKLEADLQKTENQKLIPIRQGYENCMFSFIQRRNSIVNGIIAVICRLAGRRSQCPTPSLGRVYVMPREEVQTIRELCVHGGR